MSSHIFLGDPFVIEGVTLSPVPSVLVNVTAVNCLGQRAEVIILYLCGINTILSWVHIQVIYTCI